MADKKSEFFEFDHEKTRKAWNRVQLEELGNNTSYFPPPNSTNRSASSLLSEVSSTNSYYTLPNITMRSPNEPLLFPEDNLGRSKAYYIPEENTTFLSDAVELLPGISMVSTPQQNTIRFSYAAQSAETSRAYTPELIPTINLSGTSRAYPPQQNSTRFNDTAPLPEEVGLRWRSDQGSWWNEGGYIPPQSASSLSDAEQMSGIVGRRTDQDFFRREEMSRAYISQQNATSFNDTMDLLEEVGRRLEQCSLKTEGIPRDYIPQQNTTKPSQLLDFQSTFNSRHNKLRADAPAFRSTRVTEKPATNSYYTLPNVSNNSMPAPGEAGRRPNQNFVKVGGIRGVYARHNTTKFDNTVQLPQNASLQTFSLDILSDDGLPSNSSSSSSSSAPPTATLTEEQRRLFLGFSRRVPNKYYRGTERNNPKYRDTFCNMCYKNCESTFYMTHNIKYPDGKVQCPVLRDLSCATCSATGDFAHTETYCPWRKKYFAQQNKVH